MPEEFKITNEANRVIVGNSIALSVRCGDNIIILEDEFKSSYDCKKCGGKGVNRFGAQCTECNGKGMLLEIPDIAKARPTSGRIMAKGPDVTLYEIGERVAYSGYTGHLIPFKGNNRLRIMREKEPFCLVEEIEGAEDNAEKIEFIDKDTAYDLT